MKVIQSLREWERERDAISSTLAFVPTMGALHRGHLSLLDLARKKAEKIVVSIFVNPMQFDSRSDLENYPRKIQEDIEALKEAKVDLVLVPDVNEIYPPEDCVFVDENNFSLCLCGAHRPGHFKGVLTVVLKFINLIRPDFIVLGEKDWQQVILIKRMLKSFFIKTEVLVGKTIREPSGLALSSRNERLPFSLRKNQAWKLQALARRYRSSHTVRLALEREGFEVEYVEDFEHRRFLAATLEGVRLIDNISLDELDNQNFEGSV